MTPRRWLTRIVLAGGLVACGDISTPLRNDYYDWRLLQPSAGGTGTDSLSFHWPPDHLPLRIWVEDAADLPRHVPGAIEAWRRAFLYGEFDATVVSDSGTADVIIRAGSGPGILFSRIRLFSAMAPECSGATDLDISPDHTLLRPPIRIFINPEFDPSAPELARCLALTTTHEIGHALGIWRHSSARTDIMFMDPEVIAPSSADLETAQVLYHFAPNVQLAQP
jgi:hypothetical protein